MSPGPPPRAGGGPSVRKNFGSLTADMKSAGCRARAAGRAVVPAFSPTMPHPALLPPAGQRRSRLAADGGVARSLAAGIRVGLRPPLIGLDHTGVQQVQAVKEPGH